MAADFSVVGKDKNQIGPVIAILREELSIWERRAPLTPMNVLELTKKGVKVIIQPANKRVYPIQAYLDAGAVVQESISEASVIFGVKQTPIHSLLPSKTYCMFSYTIEGQENNMPLLDAILEKSIRLIDYEKIVDSNKKRVVSFGRYAGIAGMLNILHGLGLRLLALGYHTPFMYIGPAHTYQNRTKAEQAVHEVGLEIALGTISKCIGPLIFVFTGTGSVSQGAQEIFRNLPHQFISPDELQEIAKCGLSNKVYGCVVRRCHYMEQIDGAGYDKAEFERHPHLYKSTFHEKIAPYASVIINGIYWKTTSPRLLTIQHAKILKSSTYKTVNSSSTGLKSIPQSPYRLLAICDISADLRGSIEFTKKCTTMNNLFTLYDPINDENFDSFEGEGILMCSMDNMPTQLPTEATEFFGKQLMFFVWNIIQSDASTPLTENDFPPSIYNLILLDSSNIKFFRNKIYVWESRMSIYRYPKDVRGMLKILVLYQAIIASNGKLTSNFEYIQKLRS